MFSDRPWPLGLLTSQRNRGRQRKFRRKEAPPMMIAKFCVCLPSMDGARETAPRCTGAFAHSDVEHYGLLEEHVSQVKGYTDYAQRAEIARKAGMDGATDGLLKAPVWRTPDRILRQLEERRVGFPCHG